MDPPDLSEATTEPSSGLASSSSSSSSSSSPSSSPSPSATTQARSDFSPINSREIQNNFQNESQNESQNKKLDSNNFETDLRGGDVEGDNVQKESPQGGDDNPQETLSKGSSSQEGIFAKIFGGGGSTKKVNKDTISGPSSGPTSSASARDAISDAPGFHGSHNDPPEVISGVESVHSSMPPPIVSSARSPRGGGRFQRPPLHPQRKKSRARQSIHDVHGDDELDEAELEGILMTPLNGVRRPAPPRGASSTEPCTQSFLNYCGQYFSNYFGQYFSNYFGKYCVQHWGEDGRSMQRTKSASLVKQATSLCSQMWNPRNRVQSATSLLILLLVFLIGAQHSGGRRSGRPLSPKQRREHLAAVYGAWTFYDGSAEDRPAEPYLDKAGPSLDLPEADFPPQSWQADAVYANHFLDAATKLVRRAQIALFDAYHGHSDLRHADDEPRIEKRMRMFHLAELDLHSVASAAQLREAHPAWDRQGGWTTRSSLQGLERRLLHAMITNSNFTIVLAGNARALGYANHANQSTGHVLHQVLSPVMDRLGVSLSLKNVGWKPPEPSNPDLPPGQSLLLSSLAFSSTFGTDVDMLVWDDGSSTGLTEHLDDTAAQFFDLFARQALLSNATTTVPFLWGGHFDVLRRLHLHADVDVGQWGDALMGVPLSTPSNVHSLPYAAQYLNCNLKLQDHCQHPKLLYDTQCWINRDDVKPPTKQYDTIPVPYDFTHSSDLPPPPGWRMHQLRGYALAYNVLAALLDALETWSEKTIYEGHPLSDEYWHMGDYLANIQTKVSSLDNDKAPHCQQLQSSLGLPQRLCRFPIQSRTEYTPRANFEHSLRSIVLNDDAKILEEDVLYDGPDLPRKTIPPGEVDPLEIINLRKLHKAQLQNSIQTKQHLNPSHSNEEQLYKSHDRHLTPIQRRTSIEPGKGWKIQHAYPGQCDGSPTSFTCGRSSNNPCLLDGHQGSRGGLWGGENNGWLVLNIGTVDHGFIALNLELGERTIGDYERKLTDQWGSTLRRSSSSSSSPHNSRQLLPTLPDDFVLEYALNDDVTTLDKSSLLQRLITNPDGMQLLILLDDESNDSKQYTVGVRVRGCTGASCKIGITHAHWI